MEEQQGCQGAAQQFAVVVVVLLVSAERSAPVSVAIGVRGVESPGRNEPPRRISPGLRLFDRAVQYRGKRCYERGRRIRFAGMKR